MAPGGGDWYRAEILFKGTPELVERLQSAVAGQELVEIGSLEIARCTELVPADEPRPVGLHGPRVLPEI